MTNNSIPAKDFKHGSGVYNYAGGAQYDGPWHMNKKHGRGRMKFENGDEYDGNWNMNKRDF